MYKLLGCLLSLACAVCSADEATSPMFRGGPALTGAAQGTVVANLDGDPTIRPFEKNHNALSFGVALNVGKRFLHDTE